MCATCGCGLEGEARLEGGHAHEDAHAHDPAHPHPHEHPHSHEHPHERSHPHEHPHAVRGPRVIQLEQEILEKNARLARGNRAWLQGRQVLALNLLSSPGAGKTTLLEATITELQAELCCSVIEGDQETTLDADRIRAAGARAIQVNTGSGCHLDAAMVARCLPLLDPPRGSVLLIENVGNLVCPALFDLGERAKVVIVSTTEGEDKPLKYPHVFRASELMILNKVDLLPHLSFDAGRLVSNARRVNPAIEVLAVSATRGDGLADWGRWLRSRLPVEG